MSNSRRRWITLRIKTLMLLLWGSELRSFVMPTYRQWISNNLCIMLHIDLVLWINWSWNSRGRKIPAFSAELLNMSLFLCKKSWQDKLTCFQFINCDRYINAHSRKTEISIQNETEQVRLYKSKIKIHFVGN